MDPAIFHITSVALKLTYPRRGGIRGLPGWATLALTPSHTGTKTGGQSQAGPLPPSQVPLQEALSWFLPSAGDSGLLDSGLSSWSSHTWTGAARPSPCVAPPHRPCGRMFAPLKSHSS